MARILPPSVFKANFEAAEFKPTQSQRVGERFATPEGLKVGVDVIDKVGGTVADAVSRFSRGRSALARARKAGKLGKDTGMFGTQYLTLNEEEQKLLERQSYGAGQATVVGARDRNLQLYKDGKAVLDDQENPVTRFQSGTDERAAGYDAMRSAWDRPGSGRLLADPTRDPSRLISEDYKRLASASPLPKAGAAPKPIRPMLDDVRSRHKTNKPIVDDMNTAILVREGIAKNPVLSKGFDINNLTDKQAEALVNASSGKLLLLRDDSGDKSVYTVQVRPTKEDEVAMATAMAEGRQSEADNIRDGLRARGRALLGLLNNPNLDQASTDLNKYSMLLDQWRSIVAVNPQDPRAAKILIELESYSGNIAQASGDLPTYLRNYGVRASEAQAAADKKASDVVGAKRERAAELQRKIQVDGATSEEKSEYIKLEKEIKQAGGTVDNVEPIMSPMDTAGDYSTPALTPGEKAQEDAWSRATQAAGRTESEPVSDAVATPPAAPPAAAGDAYMQVAERMRQAGISEENIEIALPGYSYVTTDISGNRSGSIPAPLINRLLGDTKPRRITYDKSRTAFGSPYNQWLKRTEKDRAKTTARMEAARLKTKETFKQPAKPKLTAGPKPVSTQNITQKIGDKTVTHKFPTYKPMAVNAKNKKRRLPAVSAKDKARRVGLLRSAAKKYKIDPDLYVALADQESKYHDKAVSDQYAIGLTQMTPTAWLDIGGKPEDFKTLFNESVAAESGAKFLHLLRKRLIAAEEIKKNDPKENEKIMAVYNAGLSAFRNEGFEIKSKKRKDGTFFSGLMNPKRSVPLKDKKGNKIFQKDAKGNKIPLKGKDGKQLKDSKGRLRWKIKTRDGETYNYVTKIMKNYKKIKALAAKGKAKKVKNVADKPGPKAPKEGS
jgi:hypothetical protein